MSRQMFRKMTQPEVELAKSLVKLAFPKLKHIGDMKVSGDKVLYFGQYKMSLIFPNDYKTVYNVGTIKYEDRWAYEVALHQYENENWEKPTIVTRWIHPDTLEMYDDPQILKDEYRTLPYLSELCERHPR